MDLGECSAIKILWGLSGYPQRQEGKRWVNWHMTERPSLEDAAGVFGDEFQWFCYECLENTLIKSVDHRQT